MNNAAPIFSCLSQFSLPALCVALLTSFANVSAHAQGFSAVVSPPRFEFTVLPGKTARQIIEITHVSVQKGTYRLYTNDWTMDASGGAVFADALATDSCRQWVALERREVTIGANAKMRFRYEFAPPADATSRECRFAIMIEGSEQVVKTDGAVSFPVSGRVGVVVYASIGDALPKLDITPEGTSVRDGITVPMLQVRNTGTAHGRLSGVVQLVDSTGRKLELSPDAVPILPGQTRVIALLPVLPANTAANSVTIRYPATIKGAIEWGKQKTDLDYRIESATPPPRVVLHDAPRTMAMLVSATTTPVIGPVSMSVAAVVPSRP